MSGLIGAFVSSNPLSRITERYEALQRVAAELMRPRGGRGVLDQVLGKAVDLMECDGGSLYLVHGDELTIEIALNRSVRLEAAKRAVPVDGDSLAAYSFRTGVCLNVADAYQVPADTPFRIDLSFDRVNGYRTRSVLTQPLVGSKANKLGVLQLINRKRRKEDPWPMQDIDLLAKMPAFSAEDERLLSSFAAIASASIENSGLYEQIEKMLEGFIRASVTLIERRDPATRGHSERVAVLSRGLAETAGRARLPELHDARFTAQELQELWYAALLHDLGKVNVREETLLKGEKLSELRKSSIRHRIEVGTLAEEMALLDHYLDKLVKEGRAPSDTERQKLTQLRGALRNDANKRWQTLLELSRPTVLDQAAGQKLTDLCEVHLSTASGEKKPMLEPDDVRHLSIRRGSLSPEERIEIESHVTHTYDFLVQIPWGQGFSRLAEIAYAHHEKLDGSGYPRGLKADEIPVQSRIMAICDIFDALVAADRPYKKAVPTEKALDILSMETKDGKLDKRLLKLFLEAKLYENPEFIRLNQPLKKAA